MKIAVFLSGLYLKEYEVPELLNLIRQRHTLHFFIDRSKNKKIKKNFFNKVKHLLYFHKFFLLVILEQKIAQYFNLKSSYLNKIKKKQKKIFLKNIIDIKKYNITYFKPIKKNNFFIFEKSLKKKIKKNFDVIIFLGFNKLIHENMLNLTKFGILSFHTADTEKYRGRPSGFFEFINNEIN